jgi:nucleoside-diphosphate-sugar epimerase
LPDRASLDTAIGTGEGPGMNVTLTGGTGFFGQALLRLITTDDVPVRALVRRPGDDAIIRALGAEPVRGDLAVARGVDDLVRDGDVVIHAAAHVDMTGRWADIRRTTVDGTRRLAAALPRAPKRFLYVSSAGVYSRRQRGPASAADTPADPPRHDLYCRSKLMAEALVRDQCERAGCPWTILRLGMLYGPGARAFLRQVIPLLKARRLFLIGNGNNRVAATYVEDAARAVLLAADHPDAPRKIYDVVGDEPVTQRELYDTVSDALGLPRPTERVGLHLARAFAGIAEIMAHVLGRTPGFNRALVELMNADQLIDARRTRDELGWQPRVRFRDGMQRMCDDLTLDCA